MPNQCQTSAKYENILESYYNGYFEFESYDIQKGQAPSYIQLKKWSEGANCAAEIKYTWREIRTSFRDEIFQDKKEDVNLIITNALVELTETTLYLNKANKSIVEKEKRDGKFTSNKSESANKANKANVETLLALKEDDNTVKADVNINAEVEAGVETNLNIEDNQALATVQAMFMQPEFVEMNKKLMEKTADELQKRRNSNE
ncbi:MAG: hypothetical protein IJI96_02680 [Methanobrevibacter sp.]|nr:hypothetical protein [Methanobrevibacter sp.]